MEDLVSAPGVQPRLIGRPGDAVHGCSLVRVSPANDLRGSFTKTLSVPACRPGDAGVREVFWSHSHPGVIRGMHVQGPEMASSKVIFVVSGRLFDVVVDLRPTSPTFGNVATFELDPTAVLHIPTGCAHGFQALEETRMVYLCDEVYNPASDGGIRFDTVGVSWPVPDPVVSDRDRALPALDDYLAKVQWP